MKKIFCTSLLLVLVLGVVGCNTSTSTSQNVNIKSIDIDGVKVQGVEYKNLFFAANPDSQIVIKKDDSYKIGDGQYYYANGRYFVLHMTIKNNSNKPVNLDLTNFELMDNNNKTYSSLDNGQAYNDYFLHDSVKNEKALNNITINPGLTYKTAVIFDIPIDVVSP